MSTRLHTARQVNAAHWCAATLPICSLSAQRRLKKTDKTEHFAEFSWPQVHSLVFQKFVVRQCSELCKTLTTCGWNSFVCNPGFSLQVVFQLWKTKYIWKCSWPHATFYIFAKVLWRESIHPRRNQGNHVIHHAARKLLFFWFSLFRSHLRLARKSSVISFRRCSPNASPIKIYWKVNGKWCSMMLNKTSSYGRGLYAFLNERTEDYLASFTFSQP